ncbi:hypothetical protein [Hymenobacter saemangeumensis]|uniref:hypothetical protein n=1 Tax=Hymenobacter saemangeumensis TaxID=1084522 RepID=UPI0031EEA5FE
MLTLLAGGALVLSLGLNVLLLQNHADYLPDDTSEELAVTTAELHLAQRLLLQCQGQQQRQDSLLAQLSPPAGDVSLPEPNPALLPLR